MKSSAITSYCWALLSCRNDKIDGDKEAGLVAVETFHFSIRIDWIPDPVSFVLQRDHLLSLRCSTEVTLVGLQHYSISFRPQYCDAVMRGLHFIADDDSWIPHQFQALSQPFLLEEFSQDINPCGSYEFHNQAVYKSQWGNRSSASSISKGATVRTNSADSSSRQIRRRNERNGGFGWYRKRTPSVRLYSSM